jgi:hypothetical protein
VSKTANKSNESDEDEVGLQSFESNKMRIHSKPVVFRWNLFVQLIRYVLLFDQIP